MGGGEWTDEQNSFYVLQDLNPLRAPSQKVVECGSSETWDSCLRQKLIWDLKELYRVQRELEEPQLRLKIVERKSFEA